jgi:hypothetical protein
MEQSVARPSAPIAAILAICAGALLAIGSFLAWAEVSGGGTSVTASGVDGSDGWITLVCGASVLLVGITFLRASGRRAIATLAVVAGLIGAAIGLYDALTAEDRVLDDAAEELAVQFGGTPQEVRALLDQAIDAGELGISISVGLYLVIVGGVLGVVGGALGMRRVPEPAPALPVAPVDGSAPVPAPPLPSGAVQPPPAPAGPPRDPSSDRQDIPEPQRHSGPEPDGAGPRVDPPMAPPP